jgi:hypothetical protein
MFAPNTLTILINTRIRGSGQLIYKPYMTVPGEQSDTVYFDPLIKLNKAVVDYIPYGYPDTDLYTQFFNLNEFNSLEQRTLGISSQPQRDLVAATNEGVVDKNIRTTLDTLFKSGAPFFIGSERYTVYNYDWKNGDWEIMKSPNKMYMNPNAFSYGMPYGINSGIGMQNTYVPISQTSSILNTIPASAIKGNVNPSISKIKKSRILQRQLLVPGSLQKTPIVPPAAPKTLAAPSVPSLAPKTPVNPPAAPLIPTPAPKVRSNSILSENFINYYQEAYSKKLFPQSLTDSTINSMNEWKIIPNKGGGDCLFESFSQLLNGYNSKTNPPIIINKYLDNRKYTIQTLRNAVADNLDKDAYDLVVITANEAFNSKDPTQINRWIFMRDNAGNIISENDVKAAIKTSAYWGDEFAINILEKVFNIKIILLHQSADNTIKQGSRVFFTDKKQQKDVVGTVIYIDTTLNTATVQTDDSQKVKKNISELELQKVYFNGNQSNRLNVYCTDSHQYASPPKLFGFMFYTGEVHYEAIVKTDSSTKKETWLFTTTEIPYYIIYMIFVSCYLFIGENSTDPLVDKQNSSFGKTTLEPILYRLYNALKTMPITGGGSEKESPKSVIRPNIKKSTSNRSLQSPIPELVDLKSDSDTEGDRPDTPRYFVPQNIFSLVTPQPSPQPSPQTSPQTSEKGTPPSTPPRNNTSFVTPTPVKPPKPTPPTPTPVKPPTPVPPPTKLYPATPLAVPTKTRPSTPLAIPRNVKFSPKTTGTIPKSSQKKQTTAKNYRPYQNKTFKNYLTSTSYPINRYHRNYPTVLTYYIVIDIELYPGKNIPLGQKAVLECQGRYENIRKSYADLFGYVYKPNEYLPPASQRILRKKIYTQNYRNLRNTRSNNRTRRFRGFP